MDSVNSKLLSHDFFGILPLLQSLQRWPHREIRRNHKSSSVYGSYFWCQIQRYNNFTRPTYISTSLHAPRVRPKQETLPLLVFHVHGGGFCIGSAFSQDYHDYLNFIVARTNVVAVSVEYRLTTEEPLDVCNNDIWVALQWVAMHVHGDIDGHEIWLNNYVDFKRTFLMGDSVGGTVAYQMTSQVGSTGLKLVGLVLVHPYFAGVDRYDRMALYVMGKTFRAGLKDTRLKPTLEDLARVKCEKVLVFVGGKDDLREGGLRFCDELKKTMEVSVEIVEHQQGRHVFHLVKPLCKNAIDLKNRVVSFLNQDQYKLSSNM